MRSSFRGRAKPCGAAASSACHAGRRRRMPPRPASWNASKMAWGCRCFSADTLAGTPSSTGYDAYFEEGGSAGGCSRPQPEATRSAKWRQALCAKASAPQMADEAMVVTSRDTSICSARARQPIARAVRDADRRTQQNAPGAQPCAASWFSFQAELTKRGCCPPPKARRLHGAMRRQPPCPQPSAAAALLAATSHTLPAARAGPQQCRIPQRVPCTRRSRRALNTTLLSIAAALGRPAFIRVDRQTWTRRTAFCCWQGADAAHARRQACAKAGG